MKLLYAEDEPAMSEAVVDVLTYHHYTVEPVYDGQDALDYALSGQYDGIILDIMMPRLDGLQVLTALRAKGIHTPVLLLTAKSQIEDRIAGLDLGADDYLPKPFAMEELLARVRAMLRRGQAYTPDLLTYLDLSLDCRSSTLSSASGSFALGKTEFQLMELFMRNPGISFSTEKLLERVWGYDSDAEIGTVWVYLSNLRKKLDALDVQAQIRSRRGIGYSLEARA
ncbi:MAG: response regulator transcription factor [Oscillospiraceae bacterium]|nr:response regulator transcription factor [Oscillospiraceae bacterium]